MFGNKAPQIFDKETPDKNFPTAASLVPDIIKDTPYITTTAITNISGAVWRRSSAVNLLPILSIKGIFSTKISIKVMFVYRELTHKRRMVCGFLVVSPRSDLGLLWLNSLRFSLMAFAF